MLNLSVTTSEEKWGKENPRRGSGNEDLASLFVNEHPIGTILSPEEFDAWGQRHGLLNVPTGAPKQSDAWKAHLQRRHELKNRITRASTTTKIATPFVLETIGPGTPDWEVRSPERAMTLTKVGQKVESIVKIKRQKLAYLMQSADWTKLPAYEREFAQALYEDIDNFADSTNRDGQHLDNKFARLKNRLDLLVKAGQVQPQNGGIKQMLALPSLDESESE